MGKSAKKVCISYDHIDVGIEGLKDIADEKSKNISNIDNLIEELAELEKKHNHCFFTSQNRLRNIKKKLETLYSNILEFSEELTGVKECFKQAEADSEKYGKIINGVLLNDFIKNTKLLSDETKKELENSELNIYTNIIDFKNNLTDDEMKKLGETNSTVTTNANSDIATQELIEEQKETGAEVVNTANSVVAGAILGSVIPSIIETAVNAANEVKEGTLNVVLQPNGKDNNNTPPEKTTTTKPRVEDDNSSNNTKKEPQETPDNTKNETNTNKDETNSITDDKNKVETDTNTGDKNKGDIIVEDKGDTTNDNKDNTSPDNTPENTVVPTPNNNQNPNNNVQQNTYNPQNNQSTIQYQSVQNNTQTTPEVEQPTETPTTDSVTDTDNGDISIIDKENDTDNVIKIEKPKITKTDETPSKSSGSKVIPIGLGVAAAGAATAGGIKYVNDKKNNSTSAYDENYDYEEHDLLKEDSDDDKEDEQQTYTDEYSNYSEESIDSTSDLGTEPIDNSFKYQAGTVNKIAVEGSYEDDLNIEEDLSLDDEESELE